MSRALVLVDLQNDFLASPGLEPAAPELVRRAALLLESWRAAGAPVLHVVTRVRPDGADAMPHWREAGRLKCVRGSWGAELPESLRPRAGEAVVEKAFYSGFDAPALEERLRACGATCVVLAGLHLHACLRETALAAYRLGFEVEIIEDVAASDDPLHAAVTRRWLSVRGVRFARAEALLGGLPSGGPADGRFGETGVEAAFSALFKSSGWETWAGRVQAERAVCLERAAGLLRERVSVVARLIASEVGKPLRDAEGEAERTVSLLRAAARAPAPAVLSHGSLPAGPAGPACSAWSRRVPLGVVAVITPWNNPVAIPAGKIGPALVYGNAVAWKPSPAAPASARALRDLLLEAGVPEEVLGLVWGDDRVARELCSDARVDAVSLSGSSAAGWSAQEVCARRRIPLQAELGGNNGTIVWGDSDLGVAAGSIAGGAFSFAGQRCTANRRAIVDRAVLDDFLGEVAAAAGRLRMGDPLDARTDLGPLVSVAAAERVAALVARAQPACRLVAAPLGPVVACGAYLPPAVLVAEDCGHEIVQEETFGPVLVVQPADGFDHALELLNGVPQGLVAALFSPDEGRRRAFLARARAGVLKLDRSTVDASAEAPFGGFKASGVGPPEHGPGNLEFYTRLQAVYGPAAP